MGEWWTDFFDADYLRVYKERARAAATEVEFVRKQLRLRRGQRVLDVCCGYGRHSIPLAKAGLVVTGFDYTQFFLDKARRDARKHKVKVDWVRGDVRSMSFDPEFDAAINMFTSFGFFKTDEENFQVIARSAAALKRGGRFLLDTINRDHIVRDFKPRRWEEVGRGMMTEHSRMDWQTGILHNTRTLILPGRPKRRQEFTIRLYTLAELVSQFERAGLRVERVFGGFDGSAYSPDSVRMILIGQKTNMENHDT
jgi:SAM-dependent methyltransferase